MMKIKKAARLLFVLFAACSCSWNSSKGSVKRISNDKNTINEGNKENHEEESDDFLGDSTIAYDNLVKLANNELIDIKNLNKNVNYVSGIASIEYTSSRVTFCAWGNEEDGYNYLVRITLPYIFGDENSFIYKMTNLNLNNARGVYGVTTEVMDLVYDENMNNKFDDKVIGTIPKYDPEKHFFHVAYKVDEDFCFAVIYIGIDSKIYSINEMRYYSALDEFGISSEYSVSVRNEKMYGLLDRIVGRWALS